MTTNSPASRRRFVVLVSAASALVLALIGGVLMLAFSDVSPKPQSALGPIAPSSTAPTPSDSTQAESAPISGLPDFGSPSAGGPSGGNSGGISLPTGQPFSPPAAGPPPAPGLPGLQLPAPGQLPAGQLPAGQAPPAIDWPAVLAPYVQNYVQNQVNATAANIASSITGTAIGSAAGAVNSAAVLVGDLILYAAYSDDAQGLLNQLQSALPSSIAVPAAVASMAAQPDFAGLSQAFASITPPIGVGGQPGQLPAPLQLPPPPTPEQILAWTTLPPVGVAAAQLPPMPSPEQVTSALVALSAVAGSLPPPPPPPPLPTPDQAAGVLLALPALALPALPPPPPIGLPQIGWPFPSITQLFGLPF